MSRPFIPSSFVPLSKALALACEQWHPAEFAGTRVSPDEMMCLIRHRAAKRALSGAVGAPHVEYRDGWPSSRLSAPPGWPLSREELDERNLLAVETEEIVSIADRKERAAALCRQTWDDLRDRLIVRSVEGRLFGFETPNMMTVRPGNWRLNTFDNISSSDEVEGSFHLRILRFVVAVRQEDLPRALTNEGDGDALNSSPTIAAQKRCQKWLEEQMRAHPSGKPKAKKKFEDEALKQFGVAGRPFDRAWESACEVTGSGWNKPGRPKGPRQ